MEYYTGLFALSQYADESELSRGLGDRVDEYYPDRDKYLENSDNSVLGTYGIFETDIIPYGGIIKCASHARAYLDYVVKKDWNTLSDLYDVAINDMKVLHNIYEACTHYKLFDEDTILFFNKEFDSHFRSYLYAIDDIKSLSVIRERRCHDNSGIDNSSSTTSIC